MILAPHRRALQDTEPACYWLDRAERPPPTPTLAGEEEADLAIVGGGFTGLWAALQAKEDAPDRNVVLIESDRVAQGASGRNGGFADPSLTHGLWNGQRHFPDEWREIEALARENYRGFVAALERHSIDAALEQNGTLEVATEPYQVAELEEFCEEVRKLPDTAEFLDRDAVQAEVASPTYHAGVWHKVGGIVDPARLAWGLRDAVLRLGARLYEGTPMQGLARAGGGVEIRCPGGRVRARKVVLATNAFRSPVARLRRATIPIWDYALMTEPLSESQRSSVGWKNRQGLGDSANQFHYYRLTEDNRILWGGYDAIYHYGNRIDASMEQRAASFEGLSRRFFATFPQLEGLRWSHTWGGPIASTTRFCMDVGTAQRGRVSWAAGYTGLGVVASRYGARLALDLLDRPDAPALRMRFVKKRALPWPPEPLRCLGVALTQRAMARADRNQGRRGPWLKLLDALGVGFDS